jgi:hypothetical protein
VSGYQAQRVYDNAYQQCMYAQGHRIPVSGGFSESRSASRSGGYYPPPPNIQNQPSPTTPAPRAPY